MPQRSIHGEVKATVYKAILLDQIFTVSELCANTKLKADQIYPILARLRRFRILLAERIPSSSKAAHRPSLLYKLTEDPVKRAALADEIAPFLHLSQDTLSQNPALERVRRRLVDLAERLHKLLVPLESPAIGHLQALCAGVENLRHEFAELKEGLEIAWYESKRSKGGPVAIGFEAELSKFKALSQQLEEYGLRIQSQTDDFSAQGEFSELLKHTLGPTTLTDKSPRRVLQILDHVYKNRHNLYLKRILSAVAARVTFIEKESHLSAKLPYVLAEASARFGTDPQRSLEWIEYIQSSMAPAHADVLTTYNLVNFTLLADDSSRAQELWKRVAAPNSRHQQDELLAILGSVKYLSVFRSAILLTADHSAFTKKHLEELANRTGLRGSFSLISTSAVEILGNDPYVIKPTLVDWLDPRSVGFLVSTTMRAQRTAAQKEIFAYGPLSDILQFPGLPQLRLAIALVRIGVNVSTAWRVAETLKAGKILLVLHTLDVADESTLGGLKQVIPQSTIEQVATSLPAVAAA